MSNSKIIKDIKKMSLDELAMMNAKRALKQKLGGCFTNDQKEVLVEALQWVTEELQKSFNMRREIKALLRKEEMDRMKSLAGTVEGFRVMKLPPKESEGGGC